MLPAVVTSDPKVLPPFPLFQIPRGEFEADIVSPPPRTDAGNVSLGLNILSLRTMDGAKEVDHSSCDNNAFSGVVSEEGKKPVWGRTSSGAKDVASVVMGGSVSWPALTKSAKISTKASAEGLTSALGHMNSSPKQQKVSKSAGGGNCGDGVGTSGSFSSNDRPSTNMAKKSQNIKNHPAKGNYSNRDGGWWESHDWTDQMVRQRRFGDNSSIAYHGNGRDQDRGFHGWSSSRSFNGRDFYMQQGRVRQPVMQPPMPPMVPFGIPFPFQRFPGPTAYPEFPSQGYYLPTSPHSQAFGGFPFVPHATIPPIHRPVIFASTHQQRTSLLKQIEYYFSVENLCKDEYLRKHMDENGWVSIYLIADFKRVQLLTDNVDFILHVLISSEVIEVQGNRVRRRDEWSKWILKPPQNQSNTESELPSTTTYQQSLISPMARASAILTL